MPIVEGPDKGLSVAPTESENMQLESMVRKVSEKSIRTELCDGPVPDDPTWDKARGVEKDMMSYSHVGTCTSDRIELMERIKRGESPTWVPKQSVRRKRRTAVQLKYVLADSISWLLRHKDWDSFRRAPWVSTYMLGCSVYDLPKSLRERKLWLAMNRQLVDNGEVTLGECY